MIETFTWGTELAFCQDYGDQEAAARNRLLRALKRHGFEVGAVVQRRHDKRYFVIDRIDVTPSQRGGKPTGLVFLHGRQYRRLGDLGSHVHFIGSPSDTALTGDTIKDAP